MSIRIKLLIACLVLLGVFVGKGFYAQQTVNSLGKLAVDMYDGPVMSVNYVQLAVRGFEDASDFLKTTTQFDNRVNWQDSGSAVRRPDQGAAGEFLGREGARHDRRVARQGG